jgi:hypothetical protein
MDNNMKPYLMSFVTGVFLYVILLQVKIMYDATLALSDLATSGNRILLFPSIILSVVFIVVPSYISGWLSKDKGTMIGFLVGLVGCSLMFCIAAFSSVAYPFSSIEMFAKWFEKVTLSSIVGAVSGAAGQLHKSTYNKRVQGTAQKPRRP